MKKLTVTLILAYLQKQPEDRVYNLRKHEPVLEACAYHSGSKHTVSGYMQLSGPKYNTVSYHYGKWAELVSYNYDTEQELKVEWTTAELIRALTQLCIPDEANVVLAKLQTRNYPTFI